MLNLGSVCSSKSWLCPRTRQRWRMWVSMTEWCVSHWNTIKRAKLSHSNKFGKLKGKWPGSLEFSLWTQYCTFFTSRNKLLLTGRFVLDPYFKCPCVRKGLVQSLAQFPFIVRCTGSSWPQAAAGLQRLPSTWLSHRWLFLWHSDNSCTVLTKTHTGETADTGDSHCPSWCWPWYVALRALLPSLGSLVWRQWNHTVLLAGLAKAWARDVHWDPSQGKGAAEQVLVKADIPWFLCMGLHVLLIEGPGG